MNIKSIYWFVALAAGYLAHWWSVDAAIGQENSSRPVVLLLPGMNLNLEAEGHSFGEYVQPKKGKKRWTGLIGALQEAGHRFGGVVRPRGADLSLPRCLNTNGVEGDPQEATLFVLDYSSGADVDGLAYKTLELAECLQQLRKYTGCPKVNIVAFSAGGLVARTYLQNALPQLKYAGDVERLITISTPHLGSTQAEHFGDFLGTRATSLKPGSQLIQRLNNQLDLPSDVDFASIVVRGVRIGSRRIHEVQRDCFGHYVNLEQIAQLPLDFQKGCDQVVNVWSQNLALTRCAQRYEKEHGRPIQFLLARVVDPSPDDWCPFDERVHDAATSDKVVMGLVTLMLHDRRDFWTGLRGEYRDDWVRWQAENVAYGIIEDAMAKKHKYSEVFHTRVARLTHESQRGSFQQFSFSGESHSKWRAPPRIRSTASFTGTLRLKFDDFGRVTVCRYDVAKK